MCVVLAFLSSHSCSLQVCDDTTAAAKSHKTKRLILKSSDAAEWVKCINHNVALCAVN